MKNSMLLLCAAGLGVLPTLVDTVSAQDNAEHYAEFSVHTATALQETGKSYAFGLAPNDDVVAIKKRHTGTDSTEVHVLSAASGYQQFSLHTGTALAETGDEVDFVLSANRDLYAIKKRDTASGSTELHVLSAKSQYGEFSLHTATALPETSDDYEFEIAPNDDIIVIKKNHTDSEKTELQVLSAASGYQKLSKVIVTALGQGGDELTFALARNRDLLAIKKSDTGTSSTEVHILSADSDYSEFSLHTGTALQESDSAYSFFVAQNNDLVVLFRKDTGSSTTEVHRLTY